MVGLLGGGRDFRLRLQGGELDGLGALVGFLGGGRRGLCRATGCCFGVHFECGVVVGGVGSRLRGDGGRHQTSRYVWDIEKGMW